MARLAESPWGEGRADATAQIAAQILDFSAKHPDIPFRVLFLPVDFETSPERAAVVLPPAGLPRIPPSPTADPPPWPHLARLLSPLPIVDLSADLRDPESWMPADFHLSANGQAALGRRLAAPHSPTTPNDDKP